MRLEPDVEKLTVLREHVFFHHPAMSKGFVEVAPFLDVGDKLQFWVAEFDPEDALLRVRVAKGVLKVAHVPKGRLDGVFCPDRTLKDLLDFRIAVHGA